MSQLVVTPTAVVSVDTMGRDWEYPGNALVADGVSASVTFDNAPVGADSYLLQFSLDFSGIPAAAIVTGLVAHMRLRGNGAYVAANGGYGCGWSSAELVGSGGTEGVLWNCDTGPNNPGPWPSLTEVLTYYTFDLGAEGAIEVLSPAVLQAPGFVVTGWINTSSPVLGDTRVGYIDDCYIIVTYTVDNPARVNLPITQPGTGGLVATDQWTLVGTDGARIFNSGGLEMHNPVFLLLQAPQAGATVTIEAAYAVRGLRLADRTVALGANETALVGPFHRSTFNRKTGTDTGYVCIASDTPDVGVIAFCK